MSKKGKRIKKRVKRCPFCKDKTAPQVFTAHEIDTALPEDDNYAVCCDADEGGCGAMGGYEDTREKARKKWNRRPK